MNGVQTDFLSELWLIDKPELKPPPEPKSNLRFYAILRPDSPDRINWMTIRETDYIICAFPSRRVRGEAEAYARQANLMLDTITRKYLCASQIRDANYYLTADEFRDDMKPLIDKWVGEVEWRRGSRK